MIPSLLSSVALYTVTKFGFSFAVKQKWLPESVYNQLALQKLKDGHYSEAARFNELALKKKPQSNKALVLRDLILMKKDAQAQQYYEKICIERGRVLELYQQIELYKKKLKILKFKKILHRLFFWSLLMIITAIFFASYYTMSHINLPVLGGLLGGIGVVFTIITVTIARYNQDSEIHQSIYKQELEALNNSLAREIEMRKLIIEKLEQNISRVEDNG